MGLNKELLYEVFEEDPELITFDGFDEAIVGICMRFGMQSVIIYDYEKCIETLVGEGMDPDEAVEYFEFNVVGAWVGEKTPAFLTSNLMVV